MRPFPPAVERALRDQGRDLRVLVVRLGALGDVLRTIPAVRLIRRGLPAARICWVVEDRCRVALVGHPDLSGLVVVPRKEWRQALPAPGRWPGLVRSVGALRRELRREDAALLVDFHGNLRSSLVGLFSGAAVRLGHAGHQQKEGNRLTTTHRVPAGDRRRSRIERNLDLVRALGLPDAPLPTGDLPLAARGTDAASAIIRETLSDEPFAVVSPGASTAQAHKMPPAALLASACRRLASRGIAALVVWGPGELDVARAVVALAPDAARLAPETDLAALAGLLARARLFVGGDSGPLHLACSVGCPVVGLYGPTDPVVNTPWGVPFRAVYPPDRSYTGIKRLDRTRGFEGLVEASLDGALDELLTEVGSATR